MPEAENTAPAPTEEITEMRSIEDKLRRGGAIALATAALLLTASVSLLFEAKENVDTVCDVTQDYNYGQYDTNYANQETICKSHESTTGTIQGGAGLLSGILGALELGVGALTLSRARRYGNQVDLWESDLAFQSAPNGPPIKLPGHSTDSHVDVYTT